MTSHNYYQDYQQGPLPPKKDPSYQVYPPYTGSDRPTDSTPYIDESYDERRRKSYLPPVPTEGYGHPYGYFDNMSGRPVSGEQYADDIPLKAHAQAPPQDSDPELIADQEPPYNRDRRYNNRDTAFDPTPRTKKESRKAGFFRKKIAWVTYLLTIIDVAVFISELVRNAQLTGTPIEIHPSFNPLVGPSPYVLINMGARFVPCMKNVPGIQNSPEQIFWNCPNSTSADSTDPSNQCSLSELCGFGGVPNPKVHGSLNDRPEPDQWFRFIIPMFLHGGFVHIGFNMLVQMTMGADMERNIGWWRYTLVYFASGIFGFVMGGNYAAQGITSTGASGSLFGIIALFLLDLLYTWRERRSPWIELVGMVVEIVISFFLGLLPGLDNFSHIGGFIMGLAMGLCMMRSPNYIRERIGLARTPYIVMSGAAGPAAPEEDRDNTNNTDDNSKKLFSNRPLNFFQGRKPLWWAWWLVRAGALVAVIIGFIVLITNFYKYPGSTCSWCYHLSCLPIKDWCSIGNLQLTPT